MFPSAPIPPMPTSAPKLVASCTSTNCICPDGADHCKWYASNVVGMKIGEERTRLLELQAQKAEVAATIAAGTATGAHLDGLQATRVAVDKAISDCQAFLSVLHRMCDKGLPLSILPSGVDPRELVTFVWPKASVDLFEEVITWKPSHGLCYTPNSRHEEDGIRCLGDKPGDWTLFYTKNGRVQWYFYRSLAGEVWKIAFVHGVFRSAYPYTR
jgi:hypothetical protein